MGLMCFVKVTVPSLFGLVIRAMKQPAASVFDFDTGLARTEKAARGLLNAIDPNLKAFIDHGGKLIQYHGWGDPQIAPANSVRYYQSVLEALGGAAKVQGSYRLFMVPGMAHCGGGDGASKTSALRNMSRVSALEAELGNG